MTDISKVLGTKWKELPTEEKKQFEEDAKKLSVQYKADKAQYDKENPQDKKRKGKGSDDESDNDDGKAKKKGKTALAYALVSEHAPGKVLLVFGRDDNGELVEHPLWAPFFFAPIAPRSRGACRLKGQC